MTQHLPSIASLKAFESAARHMSFTRAAAELNLTQAAVSQHIKGLEALLGAQLFLRSRNMLEMTNDGREYFHAIQPILAQLVRTTDRAVKNKVKRSLNIACLATFAVKCVIPHLNSFREQHPDIAFNMETFGSSGRIAHQNYDVVIHYGARDWPGMIAAEIRKEELFPVCSPGLHSSPPGLNEPADMRFYTAIRTRSAILGDYWPLWLAEAGVRDLNFAEELVFDLGHVSIQAAVEGLGIMMGSSGLVASDLKGGRLVEPFRIRIPSSSGYYVSIRRESRQGAAEAFRDWALEHLT